MTWWAWLIVAVVTAWLVWGAFVVVTVARLHHKMSRHIDGVMDRHNNRTPLYNHDEMDW